jgi:hypothetical protein
MVEAADVWDAVVEVVEAGRSRGAGLGVLTQVW